MSQTDHRALLARALRTLDDLQSRLDTIERPLREPLAVIGVGCRFPGGSNDPDSFWRNLVEGRDCISEVPRGRWDADALYDPEPGVPGRVYTLHGGFLDDVDRFDPAFFGIAPREAVSMDPQQRLLLEVAWEALEHAGQAPGTLSGSATGVFVGIGGHDYSQLQTRSADLSTIDTYFGAGISNSIAAGRISYVLGLQGPCVAVDTACSSSLVALHLACQSLRLGECRMVLVGGVNLMLGPDATIATCQARMLSPTGRCHTFDAAADGYVRAEGCGVVVLKTLSNALADNDRILALVRGSAVNQDGRSSGITAPNGPAQEAVIREALSRARVSPADVAYVETHGTGTTLGDPIEVRALAAVLGAGRSKEHPLGIGSVKTNVGHLEAGAGIAGFIKMVLALEHGEIPPHLHFRTPNPHIPWDALPVRVIGEATAWPRSSGRRLAGVSSFGFSGTNCHVILEDAPALETATATIERPLHLLALSGRTEEALGEVAGRLATRLGTRPDEPLADICYSLNTGRAHFGHRAAVLARSREGLQAALAAAARGAEAEGLRRGTRPERRPELAFLYTGQGSQWSGMGRELYETQPTFRRALERCAELLGGQLERPLLEVMFEAGNALDQTQYTQPALFALEWSLSELWRSFGVRPTWVMGHSVGEYVAACVAGAYSLEEGLRLIAARGRLMGALARDGAMVSVLASEGRVEEVVGRYGGEVSVAAVNGPQSVVISGRRAAVESAARELEQSGARTRPLAVSHAFHSALLEPMLGEFERLASQVQYRAPELGVVSNLTGGVLGAGELGGSYWRRHARERVRFKQGMEVLREQGCAVFVELGPSPVLLGMGRECIAEGAWVPTLRKGRRDWEQLLDAVGELYVRGVDLDWKGFDSDYSRRKVALPSYPFQRQRYWLEAAEKGARTVVSLAKDAAVHPLLGRRVRSASGERLFENEVSSARPAYLRDHAFFGTPVFPASAYLEMALASLPAADSVVVEELSIEEPLLLPEGEPRVVQCVRGEDGSLRIFSLEDEATDRWRRHAVGRTLVLDTGESLAGELDAARARCSVELDTREYYDGFQAAGVEYGPAFRVIRSLWGGEREAVGRLELPDAAGSPDGYRVHPALLDAAFQVLGAAQALRQDDTVVHMPTAIQRLVLHGTLQGSGWAHACLREISPKRLLVDVALYDQAGQPRVLVSGLELRPARRDTLARALPKRFLDWLYQLEWEPSAPTAQAPTIDRWLVLGPAGAPVAAVAEQLRRGSGRAATALGLTGGRLALESLLRSHAAGSTRLGVVALLGAGAEEDAGTLIESQRALLRPALELAQALVAIDTASRLWIVTRGAQAVLPGEAPRPRRAGVWGFARSLAAEHPELRCSSFDLDPADEGLADLVASLISEDGEDQVACRGGRRFALRLVHSKAASRTEDGAILRLEIAQRGVLDELRLVAAGRRPLAAGEVEIEVAAGGLNFRDVLNALGMYPGDAGALGSECAGRVLAVGAGVEGLVPGDEVVALAGGALATHVTTRHEFVARRPENVSAEQAATLPIAFLTAVHALLEVGRLKRAERVLIHAAAGGVGLAAVQVARGAGAEVFATAGNDEKREYLRALGVRHVSDSRSLSFVEDVKRATNGEGVDVVLNSLTGEFIPASLSLLRQGGRFIEIGKRELWSQERAAGARAGVEYHAVFLGDLAATEPERTGRMLQDLVAAVASGEYEPLPLRSFPLTEAVAAFRFMANARHTGKIVLRPETRPRITGKGSYLVTGGYGALGLVVARWLADRGAGRVVLVGRSAPGAAARKVIAGLGPCIVERQADVSTREQVQGLLDSLAGLPPLRGIVHAAGVLDDGAVSQQTWERYERVLAPKAAGAWELHQATASSPLDFFVLFSSVASVLGSGGQSNYAAANALLDGLAAFRRSGGLHAISINWGPWAEAGMAAALRDRDQRRRERAGLDLITPEDGLAALDNVVGGSYPHQVAVLPVHWERLPAEARAMPLLAKVLAEHPADARRAATEVGSPGVVRRQLESAPAIGRGDLLIAHLRDQVSRVLALDATHPPGIRDGLTDLGMDSLMAVELRNRIQAALGCSLPSTVVFEHPTIEALASHLLNDVLSFGPPATRSDANGSAMAPALGATEIEQSLLDELKKAGY